MSFCRLHLEKVAEAGRPHSSEVFKRCVFGGISGSRWGMLDPDPCHKPTAMTVMNEVIAASLQCDLSLTLVRNSLCCSTTDSCLVVNLQWQAGLSCMLSHETSVMTLEWHRHSIF